MTCPDCGADLDAVPVGDPCPICGSTRRNATVMPPTVAAVATVWSGGHTEFSVDDDPAKPALPLGRAAERSVSHSVDAVIGPGVSDRAWRRLQELATDARRLMVWVHAPGEDGVVLCEVMDEDGVRLAAEVGADAEDAVLNVADVIAGTRGR
jgi:hypothetical protein